jgi:hypothetical protein
MGKGASARADRALAVPVEPYGLAPPGFDPSREPRQTPADTYIMTPEDFADGCFVHTVNGKPYGTGETLFGLTVTVPLGVPLCNGCDAEVVDDVCSNCEPIVEVEHIAPGRIAA